MKFERREIDWRTVNQLIALTVGPGQDDLVGPNVKTLAQAAYYPGSFVWGLWDDQTPVGLMAVMKSNETAELMPQDIPNAVYLWRLLIGSDFQGHGYGKAAIVECIAQTREWGLQNLFVTVVDSPDSNIAFYEKLGFQRTGRIIKEEIELLIQV